MSGDFEYLLHFALTDTVNLVMHGNDESDVVRHDFNALAHYHLLVRVHIVNGTDLSAQESATQVSPALRFAERGPPLPPVVGLSGRTYQIRVTEGLEPGVDDGFFRMGRAGDSNQNSTQADS